jgi:polyisoprenoid-binding protein YceI
VPLFTAADAECVVYTFKEGLLSKMAHDLKIAVRSFLVEVSDDRSSVTATFDTSSLEVVCARRDGHDDASMLSASDKKKIQATIAGEVLGARHGKNASFRSSAIAVHGDVHRIDGTLTLAGVTRSMSFESKSSSERPGRPGRTAEVRIHQPDFGIAPYSAMLGALKIKPDVVVRVWLPLT